MSEEKKVPLYSAENFKTIKSKLRFVLINFVIIHDWQTRINVSLQVLISYNDQPRLSTDATHADVMSRSTILKSGTECCGLARSPFFGRSTPSPAVFYQNFLFYYLWVTNIILCSSALKPFLWHNADCLNKFVVNILVLKSKPLDRWGLITGVRECMFGGRMHLGSWENQWRILRAGCRTVC